MYLDYEYYKDVYRGSVSEADFDAYELQASTKLEEYILPQKIRVGLDKPILEDRIKLLLCELVDVLDDYSEQGNEMTDLAHFKGIESETTKDHSVKFSTSVKSPRQRLKEALEYDVKSLIHGRLGNTGLLFRGL